MIKKILLTIAVVASTGILMAQNVAPINDATHETAPKTQKGGQPSLLQNAATERMQQQPQQAVSDAPTLGTKMVNGRLQRVTSGHRVGSNEPAHTDNVQDESLIIDNMVKDPALHQLDSTTDGSKTNARKKEEGDGVLDLLQ